MADIALRLKFGNSFQVTRDLTSVPTGETVDKAWFTIKELSHSDVDDADAILQKIITQSTGAGTGLIENGADTTATVRFDVGPDDWSGLEPDKLYYCDIRVLASGGGIFTPVDGTFYASQSVTQSTA